MLLLDTFAAGKDGARRSGGVSWEGLEWHSAGSAPVTAGAEYSDRAEEPEP